MSLRAAQPADLDAVVAIERASFSDPWRREAFAVALERPEVFFCVATDGAGAVVGPGAGTAPSGGDDPVLGYVLAWFVVGEGEVANIAVRPECRGRGVGAALLDATLRSPQPTRALPMNEKNPMHAVGSTSQ